MEIDQYLYDLNDSGEAIVAYRMSAADGGSVEVCNLGAAVLSWTVPINGELKEIASGACFRGLRALEGDNWDGLKFSEMLWEGRVEVNRVVMSLSWESNGVGMMSEVVFDYDDDNTLEITYIACADSPYEVDLSHRLKFNLGDNQSAELLADETSENIYAVRDAQESILKRVATMGGDCNIEVCSSQPAIYHNTKSGEFAALSNPTREVDTNEHYVQKTMYRPL